MKNSTVQFLSPGLYIVTITPLTPLKMTSLVSNGNLENGRHHRVLGKGKERKKEKEEVVDPSEKIYVYFVLCSVNTFACIPSYLFQRVTS